MTKRFRKLAEKYGDKVYTFALYSLQRREEAEDVTQEVLVKLWQHRENIDPMRMTPWVMRVAKNAATKSSSMNRAAPCTQARSAPPVAPSLAAWSSPIILSQPVCYRIGRGADWGEVSKRDNRPIRPAGPPSGCGSELTLRWSD